MSCPFTGLPRCSPAVLRRVSGLIAACRVVDAAPPLTAAEGGGAGDAPPPEAAYRHLPLALDDGTLFRLLPHLMCPGTMVTLRPAVIMAVIAVVTESAPLAPRARTFLADVRGKVGAQRVAPCPPPSLPRPLSLPVV